MATPRVDWNEKYSRAETPWYNPEPCAELVRVLADGNLSPSRAYDLGCGAGSDSLYLARQGFEVVGVDVSPLAIEEAKRRAGDVGAKARFVVADLVADGVALGPPAPLVLDNGLYHYLRTVDLPRYRGVLEGLVETRGHLLIFAGNANDPNPKAGGPFRVAASELCAELDRGWELVQLREFRFHEVKLPEGECRPLGWSALLRRAAGG